MPKNCSAIMYRCSCFVLTEYCRIAHGLLSCACKQWPGLSRSTSPAKLGGYLEWWREYPEKSHDDNGLQIWFICGSPLSGISRCMSVNPEGEPVKSHTGLSVNSIAKSFYISQEKYQVQPTDCEPYTLDRVIEILTTSGQQE